MSDWSKSTLSIIIFIIFIIFITGLGHFIYNNRMVSDNDCIVNVTITTKDGVTHEVYDGRIYKYADGNVNIRIKR